MTVRCACNHSDVITSTVIFTRAFETGEAESGDLETDLIFMIIFQDQGYESVFHNTL